MNHLKDFYNKTRHLAQKVVYGTNELPPNVKQVLSEVGDALLQELILDAHQFKQS